MDLKEIMSVSGQAGLFKFVSQARNGIIVESFSDKKRSFISASTKVSALEDIAIFTEGEEVPLKQVFKKILSLEGEIILPEAGASPDLLKAFMEKVLPEYDHNRVYVSDIKKVVSWYQTLKEHDLLDFDEEDENSEAKGDAKDTDETDNAGSAKAAAKKPAADEDRGPAKVPGKKPAAKGGPASK